MLTNLVIWLLSDEGCLQSYPTFWHHSASSLVFYPFFRMHYQYVFPTALESRVLPHLSLHLLLLAEHLAHHKCP